MDTRGRRNATTLPHPILDEWITLLYAEGKSRRTVKERAILIRRLEKDLAAPALAATTGQIAEWLASDHLTKATRSGYHSMLKGFYAHLVDYGYRDDNPMLKIRAARRPRRQPRPITRTQWVRLYEQGDDEMKAHCTTSSTRSTAPGISTRSTTSPSWIRTRSGVVDV